MLVSFEHVYHLPLELYRTFVIEQRHGFNKQTISTFVADELKQAALLVVIGGPVLAVVIKVIVWGGEHFYLYVYAVVLVLQVVMVVLYPTLIAPLFNTFTPLEEGPLKTAIQNLAESQECVPLAAFWAVDGNNPGGDCVLLSSFPLRKLYVMDASKRSGHSNAYFYGFCNNKRIVLFDTLLKQQDEEEVRCDFRARMIRIRT
jgi:STE24 endopeptidase